MVRIGSRLIGDGRFRGGGLLARLGSVRLNTVQLATLDVDGCGVAGLGPGGVGGAFDVPFGVLPLHDVRCCASPPLWVEPAEQAV